MPELTFVEGISRPRPDRERGQVSTVAQPGDEYSINLASDDPVSVGNMNTTSRNMISLFSFIV